MVCPSCGRELEPGVTSCPGCGEPERLEGSEETGTAEGANAPGEQARWVDLVTVLETPDPSLLMVAKSLLDAEHVPCFAEGRDVYESLGAGRVAESDIPVGPGRLRVHPDDAERALELLSNLQPLTEGEDPAV